MLTMNPATPLNELKAFQSHANHEPCHTPLNELKAFQSHANHELCHTPLNELKASY
jgi:hypothetical protein